MECGSFVIVKFHIRKAKDGLFLPMYMIEKSLKIFLRELKKFCNTFCSDFSTLFDEYPSLDLVIYGKVVRSTL